MGKKGVFVSSVTENSLAFQVGLQVGDQLLEVCGLNLRACGKERAALVLHQVGNTITMKVQFNPVEYHHSIGTAMGSRPSVASGVGVAPLGRSGGNPPPAPLGDVPCRQVDEDDDDVDDDDDERAMHSSESSGACDDDDEDDEEDDDDDDEDDEDAENTLAHHLGQSIRSSVKVRGPPGPILAAAVVAPVGRMSSASRSGSPTPRNSPKSTHRPILMDQQQQPLMQQQGSTRLRSPINNHSLPASTNSTLTRHQMNQLAAAVAAAKQAQLPTSGNVSPPYEPRLVRPAIKKSGDLGVRLVGGNAVGIFIHSVVIDSAAYQVGVCVDSEPKA